MAPAVACEAREILLEPDKVDCRRVVHMGIVEVRGCLHRVLSLRELPAAEREALVSYANRLLTPLQEEFFHPAYDESSGDAFLAGLISRSNVLVSDSVIVNGVALSAVDGTRIVTAPEIGAIIGADARVTVADIRLAARPAFLLDARRASGGRLKLGRFARSGGRTKVGGFGLSSDVTLTLVAGGSELGLALELPAFLAGDPQPTTGHVSGDGSLVTDGIRLGPFSAELGGVGVRDVESHVARRIVVVRRGLGVPVRRRLRADRFGTQGRHRDRRRRAGVRGRRCAVPHARPSRAGG